MAKGWLGRIAVLGAREHRNSVRGNRSSGTTALGSFEPRSSRFGSRHGIPIFCVGVLGLVGLSLAGCTNTTAVSQSTTSTISPTTTSAPSSASTTTTLDAETEVLTAYRAGWSALQSASATANAFDPLLPATMADPLLQQVRRYLLADKADGIVSRGSVTLDPHVLSISSTRATVVDCTYSAAELIYAKSGKAVPPATPPEHVGVRATLALDGSTWKITNQTITEGACPADY